MAYNEKLEEKIEALSSRWKGLEKKKMFGGICYLVKGNMSFGIWKDSLIARIGPDGYEEALLEPHVRAFDITGRPMTGWVLVGPGGIGDKEQLTYWIRRALQFVRTMPAK